MESENAVCHRISYHFTYQYDFELVNFHHLYQNQVKPFYENFKEDQGNSLRDEIMHLLGESCGPLTLDESIHILSAKDKVISDLEKRVCELESDLSDEKEQHSVESNKLNALLNDKDAILKEKEEELEQRPTQKLVDDLREKLRILEVKISEKTSRLETAEKKVSELSTKNEKPDNRWIKRIFSKRGKEASTSKISKSSSSNNTTNNPPPLTTPVIPVASTKKLVFFKKGDASEYELDDLLGASAEVLGKGTFGTSYKAVLESGKTVAVKRLKDISLSEREFWGNITRIGKLEHNNILPLLAYYYSKDEKLLVYDFMATGPLSTVLHGNNGSGHVKLNWETRAKIILSVSYGISYIHSVVPAFFHGNIKSSNVLLSPTYEALLSDHGLYSLSTNTCYTDGCYHAPEITYLRKMSQEADVYSFGVLMLEIMTGKSPYQIITVNGDKMDLIMWVRSLDSVGKVEDAFDVELVGDQKVVKDMTQLALNCIAYHPADRPSMADVVVMIEEILKN